MTQSDFRLWSWIDSHINLILGGLIVLFLSLLSLILFLILTSNEPANTKEKQPALPQTISQENVQSKTIQEQIEKAKKETTNGLKSVPSNSGTTAHIVNKTSGTVQSNDEQQNINSEQSQARNAQTGSDGNTAINKDANNNTITTGTRGDAAISANNQGNKQKNNVKPQEINSVIANNGSNVKGKVEKVSNVTAGGSSVNGTLKEKNYFLWLFLLNSIVIIVLLITVILYLKDIRNWVDIKYNELQTNNNEIQERESKISDNLNRFVTDNSNLRENVVADCKKNMETLIKENMETIINKISELKTSNNSKHSEIKVELDKIKGEVLQLMNGTKDEIIEKMPKDNSQTIEKYLTSFSASIKNMQQSVNNIETMTSKYQTELDKKLNENVIKRVKDISELTQSINDSVFNFASDADVKFGELLAFKKILHCETGSKDLEQYVDEVAKFIYNIGEESRIISKRLEVNEQQLKTQEDNLTEKEGIIETLQKEKQALSEEHKKELAEKDRQQSEELIKKDNEYQNSKEQLTKQHNEEVRILQEKLEGRQAELVRLAAEKQQEVDCLNGKIKELEKQNSESVETLEENQKTEITQLEQKHSDKIEKINEVHSSEIASIKRKIFSIFTDDDMRIFDCSFDDLATNEELRKVMFSYKQVTIDENIGNISVFNAFDKILTSTFEAQGKLNEIRQRVQAKLNGLWQNRISVDWELVGEVYDSQLHQNINRGMGRVETVKSALIRDLEGNRILHKADVIVN